MDQMVQIESSAGLRGIPRNTPVDSEAAPDYEAWARVVSRGNGGLGEEILRPVNFMGRMAH